jgi:hypothetical protein
MPYIRVETATIDVGAAGKKQRAYRIPTRVEYRELEVLRRTLYTM